MRLRLPAFALAVAFVVAAVAACSVRPPGPTPGASATPTTPLPTPVGGASAEPSAGASQPELDLAAIQGIEWVATSVVGLTPDHAVAPTILIEGNQISGKSGCNHYGATAVIDGGSIHVAEFGQTLIGCQGEVMELESTFVRALTGATTIGLRGEGSELVIAGPSGELVFTRGFTE